MTRRAVLACCLALLAARAVQAEQQFIASATVLTTTTETQYAALPFVSTATGRGWFFLCQAVAYNQHSSATQLTITLSEASATFPPTTITVEVPAGKTFSYQVPISGAGFAPGPYELRCSATANRKNAIVLQTTSYAGAWTQVAGVATPLGMQSLNCQTALDQYLAVSAAPVGVCLGADACWNSESDTHTLVLPDASAGSRGLMTIGPQTFAGLKTFYDGVVVDTSLTVTGTTAETPVDQSITSAGDTIDTTTGTFIRLTPAGTYTFTSTPTITAGTEPGQRITLQVVSLSAFCLTLQDTDVLPGTTLELVSNASRELCAAGMASFRWDSVLSAWIEESGSGSGGNISTPLGARRRTGYLEEQVSTSTSAASVSTVAQLPAGAIIERCLVKTEATVDSGYTLGVAGATELYGTLAGVADETNNADTTFPAPHPNYSAQSVVVTSSRVGGFLDDTGLVTISCIYETYSAAP